MWARSWLSSFFVLQLCCGFCCSVPGPPSLVLSKMMSDCLMLVSSNPPWGKEPVTGFIRPVVIFCLLICVHVTPFLCRRMERKVHCLVTAGKGVQCIHQCHLEQGFPLANALSDRASPCLSVGIRFLLPAMRLFKTCFSGGRTLSAGSAQTSADPTATSSFRRGRGSKLGAITAEPHIPFSAEHPLAGSTHRMYSTALHHGVNFPSRCRAVL